jgi:hypothetical protein
VKNRDRFNLRTYNQALSPMECAIVNANNIVRNKITGDPLTKFSIDSPNEI